MRAVISFSDRAFLTENRKYFDHPDFLQKVAEYKNAGAKKNEASLTSVAKIFQGLFFGGGRSHLARITIGGISFVPCFRLLSSAGILNSLVSEDLFQFG